MSTSPVDFPKELIYYLEAFFEYMRHDKWGNSYVDPGAGESATLYDFLEWLKEQRVKP